MNDLNVRRWTGAFGLAVVVLLVTAFLVLASEFVLEGLVHRAAEDWAMRLTWLGSFVRARKKSTARLTLTSGTGSGLPAASPTTGWFSAPARTAKAVSSSIRKVGPFSAGLPDPNNAD